MSFLILFIFTIALIIGLVSGAYWIGRRTEIKKHDSNLSSNHLPPIFSRLFDIVDSVSIEAARENWNEARFQQRLADEMIQDGQGTWWMIGYRTGKWYYFDGTEWVQKHPPLITD